MMLPNASRDYFGPVDIQKLHVQFLDEYGQCSRILIIWIGLVH